MLKKTHRNLLLLLLVWLGNACNQSTPNGEMATLLASAAQTAFNSANAFAPRAALMKTDSLLRVSPDPYEQTGYLFNKAKLYLQLGMEDSSRIILEDLLKNELLPLYTNPTAIKKELALTYLRIGERTNCTNNHSAESCIFPIKNGGVHHDKSGSAKAAEIYSDILQNNPGDLESRWLLNIAYMTMGSYPQSVPAAYLIPGLDNDTSSLVKPFSDVAISTGLGNQNQAGGSIVDDFNNDGYLDIVASVWDLSDKMRFFLNNGKGGFEDRSVPSGLSQLSGGLNIMQTDYNNDGLKDIFVLRGGWKGKFGREPNSLLRNNGDGTFTDVTGQAGLLSFHPTQTATWNDFNNDGWLDVFIGNESSDPADDNYCELYMSNGDGTFTNTAVQSGANIKSFVKGVTSGDYDKDGWPDIFISTQNSKKVLLKNEGVKNGVLRFRDATTEAGLEGCTAKTFPTWFWDYDNDGWLDLLVCNYDFDATLGVYAAAEALHLPTGNSAKQYLYRNNRNGTFTDVTEQSGLNKLQKGHGVSFADLDNDGDEDIFIKVGGAYKGDAYQNSLYLNPGQNNNHWINLSLEGTQSNRAAIGAQVKVTFKEGGMLRSVYRDVNSGGSFGASPLRQHIGIGQGTSIESIEIRWPVSKRVQVFKNLKADQNIHIKEGAASCTSSIPDQYDLSGKRGVISCGATAKVQ